MFRCAWVVLAAAAWVARAGPGPPGDTAGVTGGAHPGDATRTSTGEHPGDAAGNPPCAFLHALYNLTIPENSPARSHALSAPDASAPGVRRGADTRVRFRIRHGDKDKFFKAEERCLGDFCFLWVRTRAGADVLNRERRDSYRLGVRALCDSPTGAASADTELAISVTDVNDLSPLFYPTEYDVTVPEDAAPHASVARLTAEDADLGLNGEIYYSFAETTDAFAVHPVTGVVTVTRPLSFVERSEYDLTVLARDRASLLMRGEKAPAARAALHVRVRAANLHAPEMSARTLPDLDPEATEDELFAILTVTDRDPGEHGRIALVDIVDGDPDGHFRVRRGDAAGEWELVAHPLRSTAASAPTHYNLTLRARDAGRPPRSAYLSVSARARAPPPPAPVFARELFAAAVSERAPAGEPLVRLKMADREARVDLEIVGGNEGGEFRVHPETGVLYTAADLDAERRRLYTLTVAAVDRRAGVPPGGPASAKVEVTVVDANDNDPVFEEPRVEVRVRENGPAGATVARLVARDADSGENGYLSYSLADEPPLPFEVEHFSGVVRTTRVLDYESMRRRWTLRVRASDWGLPFRRQAEALLVVTLEDVNDNRPQFERIDCEGHLSRNLPVGAEILTLSAIDYDDGDVVSYRLIGGNEDGCFALDSSTGVLSLTCADPGRDSPRHLNVTATDGTHFADATSVVLHAGSSRAAGVECRETGAARRLAELLAAASRDEAAAPQDYVLSPPPLNAHAPEFINFPVEVKVNESVSLGATLVQLRARDLDDGYDGLVQFSLSGGDDDAAFRVDPDTGEVRVIGHLDREREPEYFLNVTVRDCGSPPRAVSRILPVTVLDVNDNAPEFVRPLLSFRVTENALNGTVVCRVEARDRDAGEFGRVRYSAHGPGSDVLCVDEISGDVRVCAALDREARAELELGVTARDGGGRSAEARVRVQLEDVNDVAPRFPQAQYSVRAWEDLPRGTVLAVLSARDPDLGIGGELEYSLPHEPSDAATFSVDARSGAVRLARMLDYEERATYSVVVLARDGGGLSASALLAVEVLDVDENWHAPVFPERAAAAAVREDAVPGTTVTSLQARDADAPGPDSKLSYYVLDGSGMAHFTVDDAGIIKTLTPLDRESKDSYWLTVCAEDNAVVPKYACIPVWLGVLDVNDECPWFSAPALSASVLESAAGGGRLARLEAVDRDAPPHNNVTYRIAAGNPDGLFDIDPHTGMVSRTARALDREAGGAGALALEVCASDGALAACSRLGVAVLDRNERAPAFTQRAYQILVPADTGNQPLPQVAPVAGGAGADSDESEADDDPPAGEFRSYDEAPTGTYLGAVCAVDDDAGANGTVRYAVTSRGTSRGAAPILVHARTGRLYALEPLVPNVTYHLTVRACDLGAPALCSVARVSVRAVWPPGGGGGGGGGGTPGGGGGGAPTLPPPPPLHATELDPPGYLLTVLQAAHPDNHTLYYDIVDGDPLGDLAVGRTDGSLRLARRLRWERTDHYRLNVSVTDLRNTSYHQVSVRVVNDMNECGVNFSAPHYEATLSADARAPHAVLQLEAAVVPCDDKAPSRDSHPAPSRDSHAAHGANRIVFGLAAARAPASLQHFRLNELTGLLELVKPFDPSVSSVHSLDVWARDSAPRASVAAARVTVRVQCAPAALWPRRLVAARLAREAPPGTLVARVAAAARGGAVLRYSLSGGGNAFTVHEAMGEVRVSRRLGPEAPREVALELRAHVLGAPAAAPALMALRVTLVEPDDEPPRFSVESLELFVDETAAVGTVVGGAAASGGAGLQYSLSGAAPEWRADPACGAISIAAPLDYDRCSDYNFTLVATNMGGGRASVPVRVRVSDCNTHAPVFTSRVWDGAVREGAAPGSLVRRRAEPSAPLVLSARDDDSPLHSARRFSSRAPLEHFAVDEVTGAVRVIAPLDFETQPYHEFTVAVSDGGQPALASWSEALVRVWVLDEEDEAPRFERAEYRARLSLPAVHGQLAVRVRASHPEGRNVTYSLLEGDARTWHVGGAGHVRVLDPSAVRAGRVALRVRASDGAGRGAVARVLLLASESRRAGLAFPTPLLLVSALENSPRPATLTVLTALGASLHEHVRYYILNPDEHFEIGETSGAVRTTTVPLDREARDNYTLSVEARAGPDAWDGADGDADGDTDGARTARVELRVTVLDANDNCPVWRHLPYACALTPDHPLQRPIFTLDAVDIDQGDNGDVRYEMKRGAGELFRVERRSGEVFLRAAPPDSGAQHELLVAAYDGGGCGAETSLLVRVWARGAPSWSAPRASRTVREDAAPGTRLAPALRADSHSGHALVYTLRDPDKHPHFRLHVEYARDRRNLQCWLEVGLGLDRELSPRHSLVVEARDPASGLVAPLALSVTVTDANDHAPAFRHTQLTVAVPEDAPPGTLLAHVPATDLDEGANSEIEYSLSGVAGGGSALLLPFAVDSRGRVSVSGALDAETAPRYHALLTARDKGEPPLSSTLHLHIHVSSVNDEAPVWEGGGAVGAVCAARCGARRGAALCAARARDPDGAALHYALTDVTWDGAAPPVTPYALDPLTGTVYLSADLPAGAPPASLRVCARDGALSACGRVRVSAPAPCAPEPRFPHALQDARLYENVTAPATITTVKALDAAGSALVGVRYWIPSARLREVFSLDASSGALRSRAPLDREARAAWLVPVMASVAGRLAHTTLRLRLLDADDSAPAFPVAEYAALGPARAGALGAAPALWARDADADAAPLRYSLRDVTPSGLLGLDPLSAALFFTENITNHEGAVISGWVVARDGGGHEAAAPLRVCVGAAPCPLGAAPPRLFVREDAAPGALLASLAAPHSAPHVRYRLAAPPSPLFSVDDEAHLTLAAPLDRETQAIHYIGVIAELGAPDGASGCGCMVGTALHVLDVNDNAPHFHSQPYALSVSEATPPLSLLLQVMAEDVDAGSNGEVRYAIEWGPGETAGPFSVDAESGWLRTEGPLDREHTAEWRIPLVARDAGAPPLEGRSWLVLRVLDENDSPPVFTQPEYSGAVREDAAPGTVVLRLDVTDADAAPAPLAYFLRAGDPKGHFAVNAAGELYVARPLDRELTSNYTLQVLATDGMHHAAASVLLTVRDVNDNPPYCVQYRYEVSVSEDASIGTSLLDVQVEDEDEEDNARVRFYLRGDGADEFSLDKETGRLGVARPLDRETRAHYALVAHAQDRAQPDWTCSADVLVTVLDVNDNAPRFGAARYEATLAEDAEPGAVVTRVVASDPDLGLAGLVRYELAEPAPAFRLDPASGVLTVRTTLDREATPTYRIVVRALDAGETPRSSTTVVLLTVADVNDNPPEFERRQYDVLAPELLAPGAQLLRVHALSRDAGVNADVYYSIVDGDDRGDFAVDRHSGVISVARPLDYETVHSYALSVQAMDGGSPPLSDVTLVNVTVVDANDNAPMFPSREHVARVREDAPVGERVAQLVAHDADSGLNARVTYSLRDADGRFAIDPDTGYVTLAAPLDRERAERHELVVRARDRGAPALEGDTRLVVLVLDANDNAPTFARADLTAVLRSDRAPGHAVLRLEVSDADAPPNAAPFTFDFQSGNEQGAFRIEQDGTIRTASPLDYRIKDHYTLQVRVFDNGSPPLFSDALVSVRVVEESRFPPVVTPLEVCVVAPRGGLAATPLGTVHAADRDRFDALEYALSPPHSLFRLDAASGELRALAGLEPARYSLNVTVSDGKFTGSAPVTVSVTALSDELLTQAVVVRFRAVTDSEFVLSHRKGFLRAVREAMDCEAESVLLLGAQPAEANAENEVRRRRRQVAGDLDVAVTVRGAGADTLRRRLHAHVERLEERTRLVLEQLVRAECPACPAPRRCREGLAVRAREPPRVVAADVYSLVAPWFRVEAECSGSAREGGGGETLRLAGDGYVALDVELGTRLQDELSVSMWVRTSAGRGTLVWAAGALDELALEVRGGELVARLQLGAGEVRAAAGPVADGAWHLVTLERRGAWLRLALDRHSAHAHAPPPALSLDLSLPRVLIGAKLQAHAHALAHPQVSEGFVGCIRDVRMFGAPLDLSDGVGASTSSWSAGVGASTASWPLGAGVRVAARERVRADACHHLTPPTPCDHHPCLNGGTCSVLDGTGYTCACHARFTGATCSVDLEPCASAPCLNAARCAAAPGTAPGYTCACGAGLAGARCELGAHCPLDARAPGPCEHGGVCEDGVAGPVCHCAGYWGPRCERDVDECAGEPCLNGATCLNEPGSFRCLCPPGKTGMNCGNPLYSDAVTAGGAGGAAPGAGAEAVWRAVREWARGAGAGVTAWGAGATALLLLCLCAALVAAWCRRRARRESAPLCAAPPPAPRADKLTNLRAAPPAPLNNMDTLRSYGSAGDELELPRDYRRNLCPLDPPAKPWSDQMHLHTFQDHKIYNDLKGWKGRAASPARTVRVGGVGGVGGVGVGAGTEAYHWDCSDWCGAPAPPAMTEVCAREERHDSTSPPPASPHAHAHPHGHARTHAHARHGHGTDTSSGLDDDPLFPLTDADESACPLHDVGVGGGGGGEETEEWGAGGAGRRRDADRHSLITMIEERESLLGGSECRRSADGSCSDVSHRLCPIEDSEEEGDGDTQCRHTAL